MQNVPHPKIKQECKSQNFMKFWCSSNLYMQLECQCRHPCCMQDTTKLYGQSFIAQAVIKIMMQYKSRNSTVDYSGAGAGRGHKSIHIISCLMQILITDNLTSLYQEYKKVFSLYIVLINTLCSYVTYGTFTFLLYFGFCWL